MRLTLNLACCWCIQAYFTAAVAQSTPLPFLRCPAPPSDGHCLSAAVSVPPTGVPHGPPSPDAQSGDISRSTWVMYSHSHLCSRAVVGWSLADHMRAELVNQALVMALCQRQPTAGLIMHTDRGSQYGADSYQHLLTQHGMQPSMSRKGNCWDNAVAESFFHTLKTELVYREDFNTHEQAQTAVFEYIEVFYNRQRCHSANGYLAPLVYEQTLKTNEILCPEKC